MNKTIYILLSLVAFIICRCKNDIDLPTDKTLGVLCINGFLNANDTVHNVRVTLTDYFTPKEVKNAKVKLFVNGALVSESYSNQGDGLYTYAKLRGVIRPGDRVQVEASYNGKVATSDGIVPQPPQNITATGKFTDFYIDKDGHRKTDNNAISMTINITDADQQSNYYRLDCGYSDSIALPKVEMVEENEYYKIYNYYHFNTSWSSISWSNYLDKEDSVLYETYINTPSTDFYYYDAPSLTDEESDIEIEDLDFIMPTIENKYRIMNDSRFSGSIGQLNTYIELKYSELKSKYQCSYTYDLTDEQIQAIAPILNIKGIVRLTAIDAHQYYYLKVLNAISSDYYSDYSELTGSVKIPSNVSGGSGNIFLSASTEIEFPILTDYRTSIEVVEEEGVW